MLNTTTFAGISDIGRARARNEDSFVMRPSARIAVVADGMGGHPSGDIASRIAAARAAETLEANLGSGSATEGGLVEMRTTMLQSVMSAHQAIRDACAQGEDLEGVGTTLTAMAFDPDGKVYVLGHVGDSRAYRLRAGALDQLTPDDTWVQARVDAKDLTPEQAKRHPFGHILTQCVGLEDAPDPHIHDGTVAIGDVYLLCSDGLVGMLEDEDIARILRERLGEPPDPQVLETAGRALVDAANEAGGKDNITVALILLTA